MFIFIFSVVIDTTETPHRHGYPQAVLNSQLGSLAQRQMQAFLYSVENITFDYVFSFIARDSFRCSLLTTFCAILLKNS